MFTTTKSARKILLLSSEEDEAITAATTKERITIRLTRSSVVDQFRATGDGWQTRLDAALLDWLKDHSPAR